MLAVRARLCVARLTKVLNDILGAPVSQRTSVTVGLWNGPGRIAAGTDEPAANLAGLHVVENRLHRWAQRWRLLPIGHEHDIGALTDFPGAAYRPGHTLGNLAGIAPAHAAVDVAQRYQQIVVVAADFDGCKHQQRPIVRK